MERERSEPQTQLVGFNCLIDFAAIFLDWTTVVGACGAPVVNVFACGFAIARATADTIHNTMAIGTDCVYPPK